MKPTPWTPERIGLLTRLWGEHLSAAEIARELGCGLTRCAVLGKVHRLGLESHAARRSIHVRPASRRIARTWRAPGEKPKPVPIDASPPLNIPFVALRRLHCRFPVTEDTPFLFCGQAKTLGSSYCAYHHALAHAESLDLTGRERAMRAGRVRRASPLLTQQKLEDEPIRVLPSGDVSDAA
jgi:GcrA cell cycle regulator